MAPRKKSYSCLMTVLKMASTWPLTLPNGGQGRQSRTHRAVLLPEEVDNQLTHYLFFWRIALSFSTSYSAAAIPGPWPLLPVRVGLRPSFPSSSSALLTTGSTGPLLHTIRYTMGESCDFRGRGA